MIKIKTEKEIEVMREGGKILARIFKELQKFIQPGVTLEEIDKLTEKLIKKSGGKPSFKMVPNYHWATCLCVNDVVVHGIPTNYKLRVGDILGIDMGNFYQGYHLDMARTIKVKSDPFDKTQDFDDELSRIGHPEQSRTDENLKVKSDEEVERFLKIGKLALERAIQMVRVGNRIGDISKVIQKTIENKGYSVVRALTGHGIGHKLHEDPPVPCFLKGKIGRTPLIYEGMTLAIEVIYNQGGSEIFFGSDGWTVKTLDSSLSALFEDTVAATSKGPIVLTA